MNITFVSWLIIMYLLGFEHSWVIQSWRGQNWASWLRKTREAHSLATTRALNHPRMTTFTLEVHTLVKLFNKSPLNLHTFRNIYDQVISLFQLMCTSGLGINSNIKHNCHWCVWNHYRFVCTNLSEKVCNSVFLLLAVPWNFHPLLPVISWFLFTASPLLLPLHIF